MNKSVLNLFSPHLQKIVYVLEYFTSPSSIHSKVSLVLPGHKSISQEEGEEEEGEEEKGMEGGGRGGREEEGEEV